MKRNTFACTAILVAVSGTAMAGSVVRSDNLNDTGQFVNRYIAEYGGPAQLNRHLGIPGSSNNNATSETFTFSSLPGAIGGPPSNQGFNGGFDVTVAPPSSDPNPDFYFGDTNDLRNIIDFDAGDEPAPTSNSLAIAFGNNLWTSNELTMTFSPGVTAFGFNYEDIGDIGGTLRVAFSTGNFIDVVIGPGNNTPEKDGYISVVAEDDVGQGGPEFITSITFTQTPGSANDGFIFYGFSSVQMVPLPPAALAGLGLLGGLGIARRLRRN